MKYLTKTERRNQIASAGIAIAEQQGFQAVTMPALAEYMGINHQLITYHCGKMEAVRGLVVDEAVRSNNARVMLQAVTAGFLVMKNLPAATQKMIKQQLK